MYIFCSALLHVHVYTCMYQRVSLSMMTIRPPRSKDAEIRLRIETDPHHSHSQTLSEKSHYVMRHDLSLPLSLPLSSPPLFLSPSLSSPLPPLSKCCAVKIPPKSSSFTAHSLTYNVGHTHSTCTKPMIA